MQDYIAKQVTQIKKEVSNDNDEIEDKFIFSICFLYAPILCCQFL